MTIKEFARLCGCNPQTLRYYDHVGLLKPVQVDPWSGYRYYAREQALSFVKIKNLQRAGFTIEEIKGLLDQDDPVVFQAFEAKIAQEEKRLREIKEIQMSYRTEMSDIREKIDAVKAKVTLSMRQYDPCAEFGIDKAQYEAIIQNVNLAFETIAKDAKDIGYEEFSDGEGHEEEEEYLDLLNSPDYSLVYEKHGWAHMKEFFDEFCVLEDGAEYALLFRVNPDKNVYNTAFGNTVLGLMLARNPHKKFSLSCSMGDSGDGLNHFWLLKKK